MTADKRTFVSATSASGSPEVSNQLSLGEVSLPELRSRASGQFEVKTPLRVIRQLGLVPGDEESCGQAITRDQDGILGAEKGRRSVAKVPKRRYSQVVTTVTTISLRCVEYGHGRLTLAGAKWSVRSLRQRSIRACQRRHATRALRATFTLPTRSSDADHATSCSSLHLCRTSSTGGAIRGSRASSSASHRSRGSSSSTNAVPGSPTRSLARRHSRSASTTCVPSCLRSDPSAL